LKRRTLFFAFLSLCLYSCSSNSNKVKEKGQFEKGILINGGKVQSISDFIKKDASVFYLVRHAEKEAGENPGLTSEGSLRAERIAKILESAPLSEVYSTGYKRTILTATPSAALKKLEVNNYIVQRQAELIDSLISQQGKQFLIVGHSNTIPGLLNLFQNKKVYNDINESEYDNFFVVVANSKDDCKIFELKY
jgi:2,3-bisphosphoglycerate-dependent phosphoglycerate mutase